MWRYLWNSDRHDHEEFGRGPQCSQHALRVSLGIFSGINVVLSQIMGWFFRTDWKCTRCHCMHSQSLKLRRKRDGKKTKHMWHTESSEQCHYREVIQF